MASCGADDISRYFADRAAAEEFAAFMTKDDREDKVFRRMLRLATPPAERSKIGPLKAQGFSDYLRRIIEQDTELRQSSRETYLGGLSKHIDGTTLGRTPIGSVTPTLLRDYWSHLARSAGIGARRNVMLLLSKAFTRAINDGLITVSPLKRSGIRAPSKRRREEITPLTVDEVERLAKAARSERDRLAILLMGYAGLRAGEVGGLRVRDVDFSKCKLFIRQQVVRTHSEKRVTPLKTESSRRDINVPCSVVEELRAFVDGNPPAPDGRIFHGLRGDLWANGHINRVVHAAAAAAGLPPVHSHQLRHTAVSLLIDDGANPKAVQVFVGHARIQETLDTYGHLFPYGGEALAASMERRREAYRQENVAT
jgi:integrase